MSVLQLVLLRLRTMRDTENNQFPDLELLDLDLESCIPMEHPELEETCIQALQNINFDSEALCQETTNEQERKPKKVYRECELCNRKFKQLKKHMMTHYGSKPHRCELCNYGATQKGNLNRHKKTMHQCIGVETLRCGKCDYKTKRKDKLKDHMRRRRHTV